MKCFESFRTSLTEDLRKSLQETVHSEVNLAVAPINEKQTEIIEELSTTKQLVSEMQKDHSLTKATVAELKDQINEMKALPKHSHAPPRSYPNDLSLLQPPAALPPLSSISMKEKDTAYDSALQVLQGAKRILGFSPIRPEDITYLKEKDSIEDDTEAMKKSVIEFMIMEMKIPTSITDKVVITKVFPPAKQPSDWSTIYAEFEDPSLPDLINQYVTSLLPGRSVSIYVPHSLWPRFQLLNNIAHGYRNGPVRHKTKIKYGLSDFVLLVKPRDQNVAWTYPSLDLPPLRLSDYSGKPSTSPPPGRSRTRLPSKRSRSESPDSNGRLSSKSRLDTDTLDTADTMADINKLHDSPKDTTVATSLPTDPGAFHPSACASPRASFNKNFTFGASQIPRMNSNLNS